MYVKYVFDFCSTHLLECDGIEIDDFAIKGKEDMDKHIYIPDAYTPYPLPFDGEIIDPECMYKVKMLYIIRDGRVAEKVCLPGGASVFVMNDNGKTIERY